MLVVHDMVGGSMRKKFEKEEFEEIEYEARSVKELLTEMKDVSEVIVDLAYSSLILDNRGMGEEVRKLEAKMDKLLYQIRLTAMVASRTTEDAERLSGILQVASAAETISNAAGDIANLLEEKIETRPFLPFILREGDERIETVEVSNGSSLIGKRIGELGVESETGMRIIAIKRMKRWLYDPSGKTKIKKKDVLVVRGVEDGYNRLKEYAEGEKMWPVSKHTGG